jgi:hypothetical protein
MRVGLGHFFGLPEEKLEGAAGFGQVIGAPERPAIGARGEQDAEWAVELAGEAHDLRFKIFLTAKDTKNTKYKTTNNQHPTTKDAKGTTRPTFI